MARHTQQAGFGIVGLGRFGMTLARELAQAGQDVLALDSDEQKIRQARAYTDAAFVADSLDRESLAQVGIQNCDTVVVAIGGHIDTSILVTLTVKQLGVRRVIAKAVSDDHAAVLEKLGAEVISPESDMAVRLSRRLLKRRVLDYLSLHDGIELAEVEITAPLVGKTVAQADLRRHYALNIIAIITGGGITANVRPDHVFQAKDVAIVIGKKEDIARFEQPQPSP